MSSASTQGVTTDPRSAAARPFRDVKLGSREVIVERNAEGIVYVRAAQPLGPYPDRMTDRLDYWAEHAPDRTYVAKRVNGGDWRRITYREARTIARNIGQALAERNLSAERPIAIVSGNDLEHAMLALGAMYAGVPYAPLSPAYSLVSTDYGKLKHIFGLLTPGLVFASSGKQFAKALEAVMPKDCDLVVTQDPLPGATMFSELLEARAGQSLDEAYARVGPDSVFKVLFTSGSVGRPKGVMYTHRMWCSNQEMVRTCWPFIAEEPPVILEWLPWNHTFAGSKDMGLILYNGGSLYLDDGRPVPGQFEETIRNLREVKPTIYLNVPVAFDMLVPYLRRDREFARQFFTHAKVLFYAAAGLSQQTWEDLENIALEVVGERLLMLTGLGATETAPYAMWVGKEAARAGEVGIPAPGVTLKLAPVEGKLEARVKGPSVTPGYWREPELTAASFDEEGFYKMGDALRYIEEGNPARGFLFDGRVAEDFKLNTGTWVSVGPLRFRFLAHFAPFAREVVIAGSNREFVGGLVFADLEQCRSKLCPELPASAPANEIIQHPNVRAKFHELLTSFPSTGLSTRVARIILLDTPPSIDAHELTDKGSISQRAVLANRSALVDELYTESPRVIRAN
jgi:feruloyl-CoA synthase